MRDRRFSDPKMAACWEAITKHGTRGFNQAAFDICLSNEKTESTNGTGIQKQRCFNLFGKKVLCVQDQANFKMTPGLWVAAGVILLLLVRR